VSKYFQNVEAARAASAFGHTKANCCICGKKHKLPSVGDKYLSKNNCNNSMIYFDEAIKKVNREFMETLVGVISTLIKETPKARKLAEIAEANGCQIGVNWGKIDKYKDGNEMWQDLFCLPFVKSTELVKGIKNVLIKAHKENLKVLDRYYEAIEKLTSDKLWTDADAIVGKTLKSIEYKESIESVIKAFQEGKMLIANRCYKSIYPLYIYFPYVQIVNTKKISYYNCSNFLYMLDAIKIAGFTPSKYAVYKSNNMPTTQIQVEKYSATDTGHEVTLYIQDRKQYVSYTCTFDGKITGLSVH